MYKLFNKYLYLLISLFLFTLLKSQTLPFKSDCVFWLRADSLLSLSGSNVTKWCTSEHLTYTLTPSGTNPTYSVTNTLNNRGTVSFSNSPMQLSSFLSSDSGSIFMVIHPNGFTNTLEPIFSNSGINNQFFFYSPSSIRFTNGGSNQRDFDNSLVNNYQILSSIYHFSKGQMDLFVNSVQKFPTYPGLPSNFLFDELAKQNFDGSIAEIIFLKKICNNGERALVETYLSDKYAPSVKLPANILINNSICDTTLIPMGYFTNFQWSTGATTQTISVNKSGKYWLNATNIFGRISSDTILVNFPDYHWPFQNTICSGTSLIWNTELPKNQYSFQWQDNSSDSVFSITQMGNYYVKITDSFGCSITSDTAKIIIDNFSSSVSLGPDVSLCAGNSITLTNGASPSLTYTWSTGSNNDSLLINTGGQYSVVVTNTNSCVAKDTINITIQGLAPVANFSASVGCQNTAVRFMNLSSAPSGNTITTNNWDFGDPASGTFSTSTLSNPFHTFTDTGTYTIRLNVISDAGCEQSIYKTLHIAPKPIVNFAVGNSCQNDSTAFTNQSSSTSGYSITSLDWNFGDGTHSISINPKHLYSSQSNYSIKLIATNNAGCKDSLLNIIIVKPQVKADFTYNTPCTNTTTIFQDNSIASSTSANTRSWNFGNSTSVGLTVPRTYTATGPYNVSLTVSVNGCTSTINKIVTIFSPPLVSFSVQSFCSKDTITALNSSVAQSGIISSYNWKLNNNPFSSVQNPTLSLVAPGSYPVRLTVVNSFDCKDSLTKTITVNPLPLVDFTTNPANYYFVNEPIGFIPSINNAVSYSWNINGIMTSTLQAPSVSINSQGTYSASLNLKDQLGCKNSKTKTILVSNRYLDLAILNVTTLKDDDGFMTVVAEIANYGTVPASTINLQYQISDGGNIKETWSGILNPNAFITYIFNAKSASETSSSNNVTCVAIKKVNGVTDENQNNNDLCSALYYDQISVLNPYPNPAEGNLNLPVILNKDVEFNISIYNTNGQILYDRFAEKGSAGLNFITLPTATYPRGCYIIKAVIDDKIFIKKFIKLSND